MSIPLPFPNINNTASNDVQTWSSSKILDYLKPALETEISKTAEETGSEVTFTNVDPDTCTITKAEIEILPSQQGSGDPSPSNPRPLNSFDTVYITQHDADNTESTSYDISLGETVYAIKGDGVTGEFENPYGVVDLGTLSWTYHTASGQYNEFFDCYLPNDSIQGVGSVAFDGYCEIYKSIKSGNIATTGYDDDVMALATGSRRFIVCDQRYHTKADFETAMSGVYLVYPLTDPTTVTADPITSDLYEGTNVLGCDPAGTVDIKITCTDTIGNILKKEGIL